MKKTFFYRVFSGYLALIIFLTILILIFSFGTVRKQFIESQVSNLQDLNTSLAVSLLPMIEKRDYSKLDELTKSLGQEIKARITVIDTAGKVLADSESDPRTMKNHRRRPEIEQAIAGKIGHSRRFSTTVEKDMLYVASPLLPGGNPIAIIRTSVYLSEIENMLNRIIGRVVKISLLVILIALSAAFLLARRYSRPVGQLVKAAQQVAQGNLETRVNLNTSDELNELANSFNAMTIDLKRLLADIAHQRDELQTIVSAVPSGLLVLNTEGRVAFYNREFQKITALKEPQDKFYWEILREPHFTEFIRQIQTQGVDRTEEIAIGDKTYLCSATALPTGGDIVLIFSDISEMKNIQLLKRDFVVNVSHELRTPLTAIKGFVETLEEEATGDEHHYLTIIARHTERLINIVNDLLTLAEIEDKNELEFEEVNLPDLIRDTVKIFEERLRAKNLELMVTTDPQVETIKADPFRLQQVFINLLDNAIKYTEKGKIAIRTKREERYCRIEVEDTGSGIPKEHLPRIFERFYIVDKS
ncbi:MAG: histidine kinase dimerization/phospho-acceptor domain-containing protein, partial [Candidatus Neomarinimicrobiota bacterium]